MDIIEQSYFAFHPTIKDKPKNKAGKRRNGSPPAVKQK